MRHRVSGRHLGRETSHRIALYRNLVTDLLRYERITTTEAKAKEIRPMAEKIITLAKRGDVHARRQALRFVYDPLVVKHAFDEIAPRMADRPGGYTRLTSVEPRKGDGARMAVLELVGYVEAAPTPRPSRVTATPTPGPSRPVSTAAAPAATDGDDAVAPEVVSGDEAVASLEASADAEGTDASTVSEDEEETRE